MPRTKSFCTATMPSPVVALTRATGVPNWRARDRTSTWPPCLRSSSAMFSNTRVGRPSAMTRPANTRWLWKVGGIQNHDDRVRTGGAGHFSIQNIDRHFFVFRTWESGYRRRADRSTRLIGPSESRTYPVWCSTVTPGKLPTFWRKRVRRLKSVVLPEFGGPTTATVRYGAPSDHPGAGQPHGSSLS